MQPIVFKEANTVFAEDQDEYLALPAFRDEDEVISCWKFSLRDRLKVLIGRPLWLRQLNFGRPLQPQQPTLDKPFE